MVTRKSLTLNTVVEVVRWITEPPSMQMESEGFSSLFWTGSGGKYGGRVVVRLSKGTYNEGTSFTTESPRQSFAKMGMKSGRTGRCYLLEIEVALSCCNI